jgi:hypothetical protein
VASDEVEPGTRARDSEHWAVRHAGLIIATGAATSGVVLVLGLLLLPGPWGSHRVQGSTDLSALTPDQQIAARKATDDAENNVRELGLKVAAGVAAIAAALVGWGRIELSREEARLSREEAQRLHAAEQRAADADRRAAEADRRTADAKQRTAALAESGQMTDRFTKATEQLGSNRTEVRFGGLYALERLARDSPPDRRTIFEVICAFVRYRSRVSLETDDDESPNPVWSWR